MGIVQSIVQLMNINSPKELFESIVQVHSKLIQYDVDYPLVGSSALRYNRAKYANPGFSEKEAEDSQPQEEAKAKKQACANLNTALLVAMGKLDDSASMLKRDIDCIKEDIFKATQAAIDADLILAPPIPITKSQVSDGSTWADFSFL